MPPASGELSTVEKAVVCRASLRAVQNGKAWFKSLHEDGWNGLFLLVESPHSNGILQKPGLHASEELNGIPLTHWKQLPACEGAVNHEKDAVVLYKLNSTLRPDCVIANVMKSISIMLSKFEGVTFSTSNPILFVPNTFSGPQEKADSWNYFEDARRPFCRCFLYLGVEEEHENSSDDGDEELHQSPHCFVCGTTEGAVKEFGEKRALTMRATYTEAHKKFRLHTGDLIIMKNCNPFAVELPIFQESKQPRLLSWSMFRVSEGPNLNDFSDDIHPAPIPFLEDIIGLNENAREYYDVEMKTMASNLYASKDIGEVFPYMERLRTTPGIYEIDEVANTVRDSRTMSDITTWFPN